MDNHLAFRMSRSESFRDLLNGSSGRTIPLPAATTFTQIMSNQYEETKSKVIEILERAIKVCSTTDACSARGQSFIGMTAHILDDETLLRRSFLLAFRRIMGRSTYDVLGRQMHSIHSEFNLGIEKLTFTLTDGGSNYCKAFRIFGINSEGNNEIETPNNELEVEFEWSDSDSDENDDNVQNEDLNDIGITANQLELNQIQTDEYSTENSDFILGPDDIVLPKQMRCSSHLLCSSNGKDFDDALPTVTSKALIASRNKLRRVWTLLS